jgi:hypothetical protein
MVSLDVALINLIVTIIVNIIFISPILWISGRLLVGKAKAKFTDALWIVVLGTVISSIFGYFFEGWGIIASLILFVIILGLVKHFFDCGWLKALAIAIIAAIIYVVIATILVLIGIGISLLPFLCVMF